jgi:predicted short-subunit dehydrogenase-like oxidoreductase (DUF2520 family)
VKEDKKGLRGHTVLPQKKRHILTLEDTDSTRESQGNGVNNVILRTACNLTIKTLPFDMEKLRFSVIGMGKVGTALTQALKKAGYRYMKSPSQTTELLIFAVPDSKITELARKISKLPLNWSKLTVLHTAGVLSAQALSPLARRGAGIAAFHPFQTFPQKNKVTLSKISYGIDGNRKGVRIAKKLAKDLGGHALLIPPEKRSLYHAAAVMSSGMIAANLIFAEHLLSIVGLSKKQIKKAIYPIAEETISNAKQLGVSKAVTGPAVRKDKRILEKHFKALQKNAPELARVYREMTKTVQTLTVK